MMRRPDICIPIVEAEEEAILQKAKEFATLPAELVEWRVDYYEEIGKLKKVVEIAEKLKDILTNKKLLFTFRSTMEGGNPLPQYVNHHEIYPELLKRIAKAKACDYLDVEMYYDKARVMGIIAVAHENDIDVIGSYHNFDRTPIMEALVAKPLEMYEMMADVAKIAVMPRKPEDVEHLLQATKEVKEVLPDFPLITMSMGAMGQVTRVYGGLYGSAVSFASVEKASAPGQIPLDVMVKKFNQIYKERHHIILIGFMGTGKTTVSHELSRLSGRPEIDTDAEIVEAQGRPIADIFANEGEEYFRKIESDSIDELGDREDAIISCGGGMVLRPLNVEKLQNFGTIVLLTAKPETVLERVKDDNNRPILEGKKNVEDIEKLMDKRRSAYERAGQIVISTDGKSPEKIAKEILEAFSEKNS